MLSLQWPAENNFMGKQRNPFLGFGEISGTSAHQFVFSVRPFDQPATAETIENSGFIVDVIYYHTLERNGGGWTLAVPEKNYF